MLYDNIEDPYQLNNLVNDAGAVNLKNDMKAELQRQLKRNNDDFLPWQECLWQGGVVDEWNLREKNHGDKGHLIKKNVVCDSL